MGSVDALTLSKKAIQQYLSSLYREEVEVSKIRKLEGDASAPFADLKAIGYWNPYLIEFKSKDGGSKRVILNTIKPAENFGHNHFSDRAQIVLWQNSVFNKLPRHLRSVDVGAFES